MKTHISQCISLSGRTFPFTVLRTYSSCSTALRQELTSRRLPWTYDYLHPQPSHLLDLSLLDLVPSPGQLPIDYATLPSIERPVPMKPGHHLVYFPPQVTLSQLLPDGTDTLHYPGEPFNKRLWVGGRVRFPIPRIPRLDGSRAVCIETIRDVSVKGPNDQEKIFVNIERRVGTVEEGESESDIKQRIYRQDESDIGQSSVIENRTLVFMREKAPEQLQIDKQNWGSNRRRIKAPLNPEFRHTMKPTKALLFRFSALTFNAHSIHLEETYTRNIEGHPNLLVHGPLTLTLLLTVLQTQLMKSGRDICEIEYRNIAPLFVDEDLTICGKPKSGNETGTWDVWIESPNGGLAVKGVVQTCLRKNS
ncbi:uncharacterized protein ACLA_008970 [Aspergillus clavatus NRRL 1]|uniref:Uncharacterized protein n=1 Tax=Aspergillus clavatus (strain ATCC 1007 / CBS 513.65 / DSM 816 / NCTC 3887 / NRRL 1 / QM 1276 / 107) TaxID=344612 RepID=A1C9Q9_ASPCL|nr:uncharacterized protein ACLA_008970 [Aspergillus clavatus NRRL 1]EAW12477.1 conserved hypothetical protein [Aspergillus clavatus NRRL 1]